MSSEFDLTSIKEILKDFAIQKYILYATLAVLTYDLAASFELEIKYFWRRQISAVALLYFTTRYCAILATILQLLTNTFNANDGICRMQYFVDVAFVIIMLCVDYILLLRVRALYSQGRAVSIVLFSAFGINAIADLVFATQGVWAEDFKIIGIAPGLSLCLENNPPVVEGPLSWSVPLAYGALLLALALYKAATFWKEVAELKGVSLVKVLIRDQVLYFLAMLFVCIANIVTDAIDLSSLLGAVFEVVGSPGFLSILGARLLFNMKEAGEKGLNQGTSCPTWFTVSGIDFAPPPADAVESSVGEAAGAEDAERVVEAEIEDIV